jgi:hypothetical protein
MNVAYKHLDTKLRIAELTVGQWVGVLAGVAIAIVWATKLSPFGGYATLVSAIYLGAVPAGAVVLAGYTEFDLWLLVRSAIRWRRAEGRYAPGAGEAAHGYVLRDESDDENGTGGARPRVAELDPQSLWEDA